MAAAPWTERVRERAVEAKAQLDHAGGLIRGALAHLALPMHVADADEEGRRARAEVVAATLFDASTGLACAGATMEAARILALRGASPTPTAPLPSVDDIPEPQRSALGMLQQATVYAKGAYDNVRRCSNRLLTAYNLLDHPDLPGVDGFIDAERAAAHGHLVVAETSLELSALCLLLTET
ncbi:hypothetical protein BAE44_0026260 [Dichanthelium oligosanthes]|uniref:Uncharacterized protein n=1 Tax=Dichanthelium oligosanthes TaxID=888268 RepID=A0A1E5UIV3_9POAL|nr:hypothetical protein BAE44_0026260 [Dichanthelium oligosanthes]